MGNCLDHVPEDNTRRNVKTDLRYTVLLGNNQLIQALLEIGADPNEGFRRVTRSLVHIAARKGNSEGVALLLKYGADPRIKDVSGDSALTDASGTLEVLQEHIRNLSSTNNVKPPNKHTDNSAAQECQFGNASSEVKADANRDLARAVGCEILDKAQTNPHPNSIFGIEAIAEPKRFGPSFSLPSSANSVKIFVSCPFKGHNDGTPIFLPDTLEQLINIGVEKYNFLADKIMTRKGVVIEDINIIRAGDHLVLARDRIVVSCPQKGDHKGRLAWMPKSLRELIDIGVEKYGFVASRVTTKEGVRIDNIRDMKDGDLVILARDRIIVSCHKIPDHQGRFVWLPESLEDLINMGQEEYDFSASKVTTIDGVKIEDIDQIKDGDHVILDL